MKSRITKLINSLRDFIRDARHAIFAIILGVAFSFALYIKGNDVLGIVSNGLQVITVLLALIMWNNTRKLLETRKKARVEIKSTDLILEVSLASDISNDVNRYIDRHEKKLLALKPIRTIAPEKVLSSTGNKYIQLRVDQKVKGALIIDKINGKFMPNDEHNNRIYLEEYKVCLNSVAKYVEENSGVGTVHVFFSGPSELTAFIMPYFVNKRNVVMYRYMKTREDTGEEKTYLPLGLVENR